MCYEMGVYLHFNGVPAIVHQEDGRSNLRKWRTYYIGGRGWG